MISLFKALRIFLFMVLWTIPLKASASDDSDYPTYLVCVFTPINNDVRTLVTVEVCRYESDADGNKFAKVQGRLTQGTTVKVEVGPVFKVKDRDFEFSAPLPEKKLVVRATAVNSGGSEGSFLITLVVKQKLKKKEEVEVDQVLTSDISRSFLQLEGASFISFSSLHDNFALAATGAIRALHWFSYRSGIEIAGKGRIFNYNDLASKLNPQGGELRYHYRWHPGPLFGWSFIRANQLNVFIGGESYQNKNTTELYRDGWTLGKAGIATRFGIADKWDTGGEISFGAASASENKIELQGDVNFAWKESVSLGLGYRAHMFTGKSPRASDSATTVFREAYAELYGALKFLY